MEQQDRHQHIREYEKHAVQHAEKWRSIITPAFQYQYRSAKAGHIDDTSSQLLGTLDKQDKSENEKDYTRQETDGQARYREGTYKSYIACKKTVIVHNSNGHDFSRLVPAKNVTEF